MSEDIRYSLFSEIMNHEVTACLTTCSDGVVAGVSHACEQAETIGVSCLASVKDGMFVKSGEVILTVVGNPVQICQAEDILIGSISKQSGIATAAHTAVLESEKQVDIVCGSLKKIPSELKHSYRHAIITGGAQPRISDAPFIYLDKNYIKIFGGIEQAVKNAQKISDSAIVIQLKGNFGTVEDEARQAIVSGANILMIDTGNPEDIAPVIALIDRTNMHDFVKVAFAGDVKLADVKYLSHSGIDILCIGREIIDAPMMDMKFDVISSEEGLSKDSVLLNLMEKSELWIEGIYLDNANLNEMADAASEVLGIRREQLLVVDVRPDHITFDIMDHKADASKIIGKEKELMQRFSQIKGVRLGENAGVHSNGILGLITVDPEESESVIEGIREINQQLSKTLSHRVMVFPTGFELEQSMITDTNSPYIRDKLEEAGYEVDIGNPIPDSTEAISEAVENAWADGYGLVITSGGVGAEDKDHTVEGLLALDENAAVAWLVKFRKASGRHVKDGVRIAVAESNGALAVSFPGPNDEVRMATEALLSALEKGGNKYSIAQAVGEVLRGKLLHSVSIHNHQM